MSNQHEQEKRILKLAHGLSRYDRSQGKATRQMAPKEGEKVNKALKRAARKHSQKMPIDAEGDPIHLAFIEGAKFQAKQDALIATDEAQTHLKGGFFQLGTNIATRILASVKDKP